MAYTQLLNIAPRGLLVQSFPRGWRMLRLLAAMILRERTRHATDGPERVGGYPSSVVLKGHLGPSPTHRIQRHPLKRQGRIPRPTRTTVHPSSGDGRRCLGRSGLTTGRQRNLALSTSSFGLARILTDRVEAAMVRLSPSSPMTLLVLLPRATWTRIIPPRSVVHVDRLLRGILLPAVRRQRTRIGP